jgi:non-structural maintenance of chromosomes element 4
MHLAAPVDAESENGGDERRHGSSKHQAILSLDEQTWKDLIATYNIKESMIEHRKYASNQGPGARGWYS